MSVSKFRKVRDKLLASHVERDKLRKTVEKLKEELEVAKATIMLLTPRETQKPLFFATSDYFQRTVLGASRWHFQGIALQDCDSSVLAAILLNEMMVPDVNRSSQPLYKVHVARGDTFQFPSGTQLQCL